MLVIYIDLFNLHGKLYSPHQAPHHIMTLLRDGLSQSAPLPHPFLWSSVTCHVQYIVHKLDINKGPQLHWSTSSSPSQFTSSCLLQFASIIMITFLFLSTTHLGITLLTFALHKPPVLVAVILSHIAGYKPKYLQTHQSSNLSCGSQHSLSPPIYSMFIHQHVSFGGMYHLPLSHSRNHLSSVSEPYHITIMLLEQCCYYY